MNLENWFYEFDLGPLGRTSSMLPPEVRSIHQTRLEMVNGAIDRHFPPDRLATISCLDVGCHEGFYAIELAKRGVRRIRGVDVRDESLNRARFVAKTLGFREVQFEHMNADRIGPATIGKFDLTLALGLLYHLENPMLCLRNIFAVTNELCVLETQVIDEVEGIAEWGARMWTRPYQGVVALIDEGAEFNSENRETGATPLAFCPSRKGLTTMLMHAGFPRWEFMDPPPGAYEQFARGKRVVCAAFKS